MKPWFADEPKTPTQTDTDQTKASGSRTGPLEPPPTPPAS